MVINDYGRRLVLTIIIITQKICLQLLKRLKNNTIIPTVQLTPI